MKRIGRGNNIPIQCCICTSSPKTHHLPFSMSLPCQFVQVGEYSLWNIFYEVMIHIQGVDIG